MTTKILVRKEKMIMHLSFLEIGHPMDIITEEDHKKMIKNWFDEMCEGFARFSFMRVLEDDTPCDITHAKDKFKTFYAEMYHTAPPKGLFEAEVKKRCKKENNTRWVTTRATMSYGHCDQDNDDDWDDQDAYYWRCYENRPKPDDEYQ
jgi:hypothetical protein